MRTPALINPQVLDVLLFNTHTASGPVLGDAEDIIDYVEALPAAERRLLEGVYWELKSVAQLAVELELDKSAAHRLLRAARAGVAEFLRMDAEGRAEVLAARQGIGGDAAGRDGVAVRVPHEGGARSPRADG